MQNFPLTKSHHTPPSDMWTHPRATAIKTRTMSKQTSESGDTENQAKSTGVS